MRCGYRNEYVTVNECYEMCTNLQRIRGVNENPMSTCIAYSRCKCEEPADGDNFIFVNLDTLEAQYDNELQEFSARHVRLWIELHDQVPEVWDHMGNVGVMVQLMQMN
ncbi:hypothetical protein QAD02_005226 [Eretmocerus hayati]|uniref:Uncharacterized protein n=1 Tax=Eretmocerus hayati TaxID=131215 RepID=A0ACC2NS99_9HYME|nr:hypothetical protein QAD02_005226 [Eretmocerus hayati]